MTGTTQIEAGRELDALVAVEVMGWTERPVGALMQWFPPRYRDKALEYFDDPCAYSTTGDGMLAVLERMRALGWQWDIENEPDFGWWVAMFHVTDRTPEPPLIREVGYAPNDGGKVNRADTLPHAVCLASLEAVRA